MCGIFGYIGYHSPILKKAVDIIKHRGPDSEGYLMYDTLSGKTTKYITGWDSYEGRKLLLGFRRLAIIDLEVEANQPLSSEDGDYHIVFNGEIYNYIELRVELSSQGVKFSTNSDTEVLLKSYIFWGVECLNKFNGMWAFAIIDKKRNTLFCARDRFGVKPFYYAKINSTSLVFGSEIKQLIKAGIQPKVNEKVLRDYLEKSIMDHTAHTFYKDVYALLPGNYFEINLKNEDISIIPIKYYDLSNRSSFYQSSYDDAKEQFRTLFFDSVMLRLRSDVPVGSCLSGGLDSSSIVSVASCINKGNLHAFTSQFDIAEVDESNYVKMVSDKYASVKNHFCSLSEKKILYEFDEVLWHQDEPFGSMSIMSQWEVMKLSKKNEVKVLLDGQGGDEILGGYRKYYAFHLKEQLLKGNYWRFTKDSLLLLLNPEFNFFNSEGIRRYLIKKSFSNLFSEKTKSLELTSDIHLSASSTVRDRSLLDIQKYSYPPLLRYEDRNSMAWSLETRVPFMDYRIVEFLIGMPSNYLIRDGFTKALMRDGLKGILPEGIRLRKSKLGFAAPQEQWMSSSLFSHFKNYFSKIDNPYINKLSLIKEFEKFKINKKNSNVFFRIYCFDRWFQNNIR